jgi:hypothetical protein
MPYRVNFNLTEPARTLFFDPNFNVLYDENLSAGDYELSGLNVSNGTMLSKRISDGVVKAYSPEINFYYYAPEVGDFEYPVTISGSALFAGNNRLEANASTTADRRTQTISFWIKRATLGDQHYIMGFYNNSSNYQYVRFESASDRFTNYERFDNTIYGYKRPDMQLRDPAAWYHIMMVYDTYNATTEDRLRFYINGERVSDWDVNSNQYGSGGLSHWSYTDSRWDIGAYNNGGYGKFYLADFKVISGSALEPTDLGMWSATVSGAWVPKEYNGWASDDDGGGFWLAFSDSSNMGKDYSGNGNHWNTAGTWTSINASNDSPTNNHAVLNPFETGANITLSQGNTKGTHSYVSNPWQISLSSIRMTSGKFYAEAKVGDATELGMFGVCLAENITSLAGSTGVGNDTNGGSIYNRGSGVNAFASYYNNITSDQTEWGGVSVDDVMQVAFDADTGKAWLGVNNVWMDSGNPALGSSPSFTLTATSGIEEYAFAFSFYYQDGSHVINFGQYGFDYTPPEGFVALTCSGLPEPAYLDGGEGMDVLTWTGDDSFNRQITGLRFTPDFAWCKCWTQAYDHNIFDSVRASTLALEPQDAIAEALKDGVWDAFISGGFQIDNGIEINESDESYVAWCLQEGAQFGFDIASYTGTHPTPQAVPHSLGTTPDMFIVKSRANARNWIVYHKDLGATKNLLLDSNAAATSDSTLFNSTEPTSTNFSVNGVGANSVENYIAYLFTSIEGFSKVGSYVGGTAGKFIYCGFKPRWIIFKNVSANSTAWATIDTARNPYNVAGDWLWPDTDGAKITYNEIDFLSNGFRLVTTNRIWLNSSAAYTYVYIAFAEHPFKIATAH